MYEEKSYKVGINWVGIIVKIILIILFVLLLLWIIPNPQLDTFYDRVFNENIQTMRVAARDYYTVDKLPKNVGESTSMTLKDMINAKMVLPFVDKDNNTCNENNSYVQVTKTGDNEYVLKVQLTCGSQSDYILDTIGCYDLCPNGTCTPENPSEDENKEPSDPTPSTPVAKVTEYQFRKAVDSVSTSYTCPDGYTKDGKKCFTVVDIDRIDATPKYGEDTELVVDAIPNVEQGGVVYAEPIKTLVGTSTTCPSDDYIQIGSYCYLYTSKVVQGGEAVCPAGYTELGSTCYIVTKPVPQSSSEPTCPNGYDSTSDGRCRKLVGSAKIVEASKDCPSGYDPNGSNCAKKVGSAQASYGNWNYKSSVTVTERQREYETATERKELTNSVYKKTCQTCYTYAWYYTYTTYTRSVNYTCSTGKEVNGSCYLYADYNVTPGSKSCDVGQVEGNYCYVYETPSYNKDVCQLGFTYNASDGLCYHYEDKVSSESTCPPGFTPDINGLCYTRTVPSVENIYS